MVALAIRKVKWCAFLHRVLVWSEENVPNSASSSVKSLFFKRAVLLPCNSSREYSLAQDHFSANQFEPILLRKFGTKKLKRDATPTIFSQQHLRTSGKPTTLGIAQCLFS